jgi:Rrf2 family iron-sulfur cluster assembly transcriptional regulator
MQLVFHRRTDLALSALRALGDQPDPQPGVVLADRIGTSVSFLPQIMAPLIQTGWVASERGPGGGYRLNPSAADAHLLDVIEATEGTAEEGRCVMRPGPCPGDPPCEIHPVWVEARRVLVEGFERIPAITPKGTKQ